MRTEVRFAGFGGQGIISAGKILGQAAAINEDKNAVLIQSYGPEARGGACCAEVVIDEEEIDYPQLEQPDVSVLLSQEAFDKYAPQAPTESLLLLDSDLIENGGKNRASEQVIKIRARKIAEELGNKIVANSVILGRLASLLPLVSPDSLLQALLDQVPENTREINRQAFERGLKEGQ